MNSIKVVKSYVFLRVYKVSRENLPVSFSAQNPGILQPIDSHLVKKIQANAGVFGNVHKMCRCLNWSVQSERNIYQRLLPSKNKQKVLSSLKNHTQPHGQINKKLRYSTIDQECLLKRR